jgi:hypothetical protein
VSIPGKLRSELRTVGLTTLFFAAWFAVLIALKSLILAEYSIEFRGLSIVVIGALIVAKVVVVLENVPIDRWIGERTALTDVLVRTTLYGLGVVVVLLVEKAFEARHEAGGFIPSLLQVVRHEDLPHILAAAIGVTGALLVFNTMSVIRRHVGNRGLFELFLSPLPEEKRDEP